MKPDRNLTEASRPQQRAVFDNRKPAVSSGFCEADERARTVDLLHGNDTCAKRLEPSGADNPLRYGDSRPWSASGAVGNRDKNLTQNLTPLPGHVLNGH